MDLIAVLMRDLPMGSWKILVLNVNRHEAPSVSGKSEKADCTIDGSKKVVESSRQLELSEENQGPWRLRSACGNCRIQLWNLEDHRKMLGGFFSEENPCNLASDSKFGVEAEERRKRRKPYSRQQRGWEGQGQAAAQAAPGWSTLSDGSRGLGMVFNKLRSLGC